MSIKLPLRLFSHSNVNIILSSVCSLPPHLPGAHGKILWAGRREAAACWALVTKSKFEGFEKKVLFFIVI